MTTVIATHSGAFHADDVFGVAVLAALYPDHRILRTRDPAAIAPAHFVVDVGGVWDAGRGRFDHHQRGFGGARMRVEEDGSTAPAEGYASAGLVWRACGLQYVRHFAAQMDCALEDGAVAEVADDVDASLVRYLDLVDTGAQEVAPGIFGLSSQIALLNSTWLEEGPLDRAARADLQMQRFGEAMALARRVLDRFLLRRIGQVLAAGKVRGSERLFDGRVLHLADGGLPWTKVVIEEMPQVLLVVYPEESSGQHQIRTVPVTQGSFESRMDLPAEWAGLREGQLAPAIGVPDAVFCHSNLFIAGARSLEGALAMARMALDAAR